MLARLTVAAALCCALASCSTLAKLESAKITPTQVYVAANTFDAVEATATNYVRLPLCETGQTFVKNACSSKAAIAKIVPAIRAGRAARTSLEAFAKAHPGAIGASGLYEALTTAVSTIQTILATYGVSK